MDLQLKGKTALISGSSKGIGLSIASILYNEGCNVVINSRNIDTLKAASKKIADDVSYFTADVTKNSECKKLVKHTIKTFGNIDGTTSIFLLFFKSWITSYLLLSFN